MNILYLTELRLQERVFMGMGREPFMDIQPSDAAICDRAVGCVLPGRGKKLQTHHLRPHSDSISSLDIKCKGDHVRLCFVFFPSIFYGIFV